MKPLQEHLQELINRIVESVRPLSIVLFGSAARGEMGIDSDVDILVLMPDGTHRRHTAQFLHTKFFGIPFAVDVIVATPADIKKYGKTNGLIYQEIIEEGVTIYGSGLELA
jgi:uncharacterized protein